MAITFNADEIFEMAEEIERNAAKLYREAADITPDKKTRQMFLDMAAMENGHLIIFENMRRQLSEREKEITTFDPDNQAVLYLQTMADSHGHEGKISVTQKLTGKETTDEILRIALKAEKESVVFYSGIKGFVPVQAGKDKVEDIIREELGHIAFLNKQLLTLK